MADYTERATELVDAWLTDCGDDVEIDDAGGTLRDVLDVEVEAKVNLERRIAEALRLVDRDVTMLERGTARKGRWLTQTTAVMDTLAGCISG